MTPKRIVEKITAFALSGMIALSSIAVGSITNTNKIAHENGNPICFKGSSILEEVTVDSAVKNIYSAMFCDCTKLKTVNFTKEFLAQKPYIGAGAFTRCTSLR